MKIPLHLVRALLTDLDAFTTQDAARGVELDLGLELEPLGVVAPETVQRAAFQKHRRADARTIVDRKTLYIEDETSNWSHFVYFTVKAIQYNQ